MPRMADLCTLEQVNLALRLDLEGTAPDFATDPRTPDIRLKIAQASDIVLDYINTEPGPAPSPPPPPPPSPPPPATVGAVGLIADGAQQVVLPDYVPLPFMSVSGGAAVLEGDGMRVTVPADYVTSI